MIGNVAEYTELGVWCKLPCTCSTIAIHRELTVIGCLASPHQITRVNIAAVIEALLSRLSRFLPRLVIGYLHHFQTYVGTDCLFAFVNESENPFEDD